MNVLIQIIKKAVRTFDDNRSLLPRLIVGLIFLSEGIQKYLFPNW